MRRKTGMKFYFSILFAATIIFFTSVSCKRTSKIIEEVESVEMYGICVDSLNVIQDNIKEGEFLATILGKYISASEIDKLVRKTSDVMNPRDIRIGNPYCIILDKDSVLKYFVYEKNAVDYVLWSFSDSITAVLEQKNVNRIVRTIEGEITSSLWNSIIELQASPVLAVELSDIYAWKIDFFGIQPHDAFKVVFEEMYVDTSFIGIGKIIACNFLHDNKNYYAFRFQPDSLSVPEYYNQSGENLRTAFLKAPLKYSRISSKFSHSRMHPILRIRRPHHGVDYAAPQGTPVHSIGTGKVISAGYNKGAGYMVKIEHNSTYTTAYLHLRNFAKGIKKGKRVAQGEVIGYVGSTGLSTGPHLDFRVYKNGTPIDPLKLESPPAPPVKEEFMPLYTSIVDSIKPMVEFNELLP